MNNKAEITKAMNLYFDGLYHSDVAVLKRVFHEKAIYACATDGELIYKTMEEYFPIVAARQSPASRNEVRRDMIESIEFAGEVTARVKAKCSIEPKHFTDFLTLVKLGGEWRIISKVFHYTL